MARPRENPMIWAVQEPTALHRRVQQGLPYSFLEKFREAAHLTLAEVAELVLINGRTLARRRKEGGRLRPDESDRLVRAGRVFARAIELFDGDVDAARGWMREPQIALGGMRPVDFMKTDAGAREVERVIGRIEHGLPL